MLDLGNRILTEIEVIVIIFCHWLALNKWTITWNFFIIIIKASTL